MIVFQDTASTARSLHTARENDTNTPSRQRFANRRILAAWQAWSFGRRRVPGKKETAEAIEPNQTRPHDAEMRCRSILILATWNSTLLATKHPLLFFQRELPLLVPTAGAVGPTS